MGQYWTWYCISNFETVGGWGKLGEWIGTSMTIKLVALLGMYREPANPLGGHLVADTLAIEPNFAESHRTTLGSLPVEIHMRIMEELSDYRDALRYALTDTFIWSINYAHLARLRKQVVCPWAGRSIICLGDYAETLPERVLADKEVPQAAEFQRSIRRVGYSDDSEDGEEKKKKRRCYLPRPFPYKSDIFGNDELYRMLGRSSAAMDTILTEWCGCWRRSYQLSTDYTLRNLSRHSYVRASKLWDLPRYKENRGRRFLGLGDTLSVSCAWSQDDSTAHSYDGLHEGPWAGDRLDVVVFDEESSWANEWEDVSDEIRGKLEVVFEDE